MLNSPSTSNNKIIKLVRNPLTPRSPNISNLYISSAPNSPVLLSVVLNNNNLPTRPNKRLNGNFFQQNPKRLNFEGVPLNTQDNIELTVNTQDVCPSCLRSDHHRTSSFKCPFNPNYKSPSNISSDANSKLKKCKCGSQLHFRTSHRHCPLNSRFLVSDSETRPNCKSCGSFDHLRKSHKDCPFNISNTVTNQIFEVQEIHTEINSQSSQQDFTLPIFIHSDEFSTKPTYLIARILFQIKNISGNHVVKDKNDPNYGRHVFSKREFKCQFCDAFMWFEEKTAGTKNNPIFSTCCLRGKVSLPKNNPLPTEFYQILTGTNQKSKNFRQYIRLYNSILSFTSINTNLDKGLMSATNGTYTFRINGTYHHSISGLLPNDPQKPSFSQIYLYDPDFQINYRSSMFKDKIDQNFLMLIQSMLFELNPYVKLYQQVGHRIRKEPHLDLNIILKKNKKLDKTYNLPTANEIAILMVNNPNENSFCSGKEILICNKSGGLQRIDEKCSYSDPLHYVLMFFRGEQGWQYNFYPLKNIASTKQNDNICFETETENQDENEINSKFVTATQYYSYQLQDRLGGFISNYGRLFHQYIVEQYAKIETSRLNYILFNQKSLRADLYKGIYDSISKDDNIQSLSVGKRIILPSSFTGGPRYMHQLYQDAMSVVRALGKPDLFVTMTCNPKWEEITKELKPFQEPNDRPDLIVRVFRLKLKALLDDLLKNHVLGVVIGYVYVVEFQKRGLPHAHILLILRNEDKPKDLSQINGIVSAELPEQVSFPQTYKTVKACMMHGKCGSFNPNAVCMVDGKCSKNFPKQFAVETIMTSDTYPVYKRSPANEENQWVVPYNPYLLTKYNCHINVEVCNTVSAVKYLYKYVYKGHDKVTLSLENPNELNNSEEQNQIKEVNEITRFQSARYVSACESCFRIFRYNLSGQYPTTVRLSIHLENQQMCYFDQNNDISEVLSKNEETQLTAYFKLNSNNFKANDLFYYEIPKHFSWDNKNRSWKPRKK